MSSTLPRTLTKDEALRAVRLASMALAVNQQNFRTANADLARAELAAAQAGAKAEEISHAADWDGMSR